MHTMRRTKSGRLTPTETALIKKIATILALLGRRPDEIASTFSKAVRAASTIRPRRVGKQAPLEWWAYGRVLSLWHQSPEFTDAEGQPLNLPLQGRSASFRSLVRRALPKAEPAQILKGLVSLGAVHRVTRNRLKVTMRSLIIKDRSQITLDRAVQILDALVSTLHFNLVKSRSSRPGRGLFERSTHSEMFDMKHFRALDKLVRRHGQSFLEFLDAWMNKHEVRSARSVRRQRHVGVGIYLFAEK